MEQQQKPSIFRKKSLERISSPEELDDYLMVTGPGVWLPLIAVVVLLIGGIVWMIFGQVETKLPVAVSATEKGVICYVPSEQLDAVKRSGTVKIADQEYPVVDAGMARMIVTDALDHTIRLTGALENGTMVTPLQVNADLLEGVYTGEVQVESVNPIWFIIN